MQRLLQFFDERWDSEPRQVHFETMDAINVFVLTVVSFAIRYWMLFFPPGVVFDEVYFGNFSNFYIKNQFFHDIHPPSAKLFMYLIANLSEYNGEIPFNSCPNGWYPQEDYVQLRLMPATCSALCMPLVYLCVRFLGFSKTAAFSSSYLTLADISLGTEGRHILSDGVLHFYSVLHCAILFYTITLVKDSFRFWVWFIITGLSLGLACGAKNTAWGLTILDAACFCVYLYPSFRIGLLDYLFDLCLYGGILIFLAIFVYLWSFFIHFILLPYAGPGAGYLSQRMQSQLISNAGINASLYGKRITRPHLLRRTLQMSFEMHRGNMGIKQFHDSQSFPRHWPILGSVAVYFWAREGGEIRCLGNVFTYYLALLAMILLVPRAATLGRSWAQALYLVAGYSASYFPFYFIPRVMYQYHYHIPLFLACIGFGAALDMYVPRKYRGHVAAVCLAAAAFGFWLWEPFMYGTKQRDRDITIWNSNWIDGDKEHRSIRAERDRLRAEGKLTD